MACYRVAAEFLLLEALESVSGRDATSNHGHHHEPTSGSGSAGKTAGEKPNWQFAAMSTAEQMRREKVIASSNATTAERGGALGERFRETLRKRAGAMWNKFYNTHTDHFFKDRNYLLKDYSEVFADEDAPLVVADLGCGVGNTVLPLLQRRPRYSFIGTDISATAVKVLQAKVDRHFPGRGTAFQGDLCKDATRSAFAPWFGVCDIAVMIFVLSALDPSDHHRALSLARETLKPGGKLVFRDYGVLDEAQLQLSQKGNLGGQLYARPDGTLAYFFAIEEFEALARAVGFRVVTCRMVEKACENRKLQKKMRRVWLHAVVEVPLSQ